MNSVHVLDCTLRDGGYCNQWDFGFENTKKIIGKLVEAGIDIIECGFLTSEVYYDSNKTKFNTINQIAQVLPNKRNNKLFVAMINYGEYNIEELPEYDGTSIDGIRIAFHKKDLDNALILCEQIQEKGYKVFVQAMVSLSYSDQEFINLIHRVNGVKPYAFYIVDSFGMMKGKDLTRLFYIVEHNLDSNIWIGFHSHNNMQLAYSNAQTLVGVKTNRDLLIDSSVYGMGRGAGNLNTELFIEYLNENYEKDYDRRPLLTIIDEILNTFYQRNYWGYSLPNYISAAHNAHPNYASYLDDKKTLTVEGMNEIFDIMNEEKKVVYDRDYIEKLYEQYMENSKVQEEHSDALQRIVSNKKVLLIAPGKSSVEQAERIVRINEREELISISINFDYRYIPVDYIFVSNARRFKELDSQVKNKVIVTSNINAEGVFLKTNYKDLVSSVEAVRDNAGLMAINFLIKYGVKDVYLAGFDGYSHNVSENYADRSLELITRNAVLDAINEGMVKVLHENSKSINISFLTDAKHVVI